MKKFMKIFMWFMFIAALAPSASAAARASRTIFNIDFDFVVKEESFPAGKYSVERLNPANPEILVLKHVGDKRKSVVLIQQIGDSESDYQLSLRFKNSGAKFVLVGIWAFGKKYALDAGIDDQPREPQKPAESLSFVRLTEIFGAA